MSSEKDNTLLIKYFYKLRGYVRFLMPEIRSVFARSILFYYNSRKKMTNLVQTNLDLASYHLKNNRLTDAKLRYLVIIKIDKNNYDAIIGLGYVNYLQKKYLIAIKYFKAANEIKSTQEIIDLIVEIESLMKDV